MIMRTTLTIEDSVDKKLKKIASQSGKTYKEVVNETLKKGLAAPKLSKRRDHCTGSPNWRLNGQAQ